MQWLSVILAACSLILQVPVKGQKADVCNCNALPQWQNAVQTWNNNPLNCDSLIWAARMMMRTAREMNAAEPLDSIFPVLETCWTEEAVAYSLEKGLFEMQFGRWNDAVESFKLGLIHCKKDKRPSVYMLLALSHMELGEMADAAEATYKFLSQHGPHFEPLEMTNLTYLLRRIGKSEVAWQWMSADPSLFGKAGQRTTQQMTLLINALTLSLDLGQCEQVDLIIQQLSTQTLPPSITESWVILLLEAYHHCESELVNLALLNSFVMNLDEDVKNRIQEKVGYCGLYLPAILDQISNHPIRESDNLKFRIHQLISTSNVTDNHQDLPLLFQGTDGKAEHVSWGWWGLIGLGALLEIWVLRIWFQRRKKNDESPPANELFTGLLAEFLNDSLDSAAIQRQMPELQAALIHLPKQISTETGRSRRHEEVHRMLEEGMSAKQIAQQLNLSPKYIYNISSELNKAKQAES